MSATMPTISVVRRVCGRRLRDGEEPVGETTSGMGSVIGAGSVCSGGGLEDITEAPHRVDHRFPSGVDLLPQVRDVQLDDVRLPTEIVVPHPVQDLRLGHHPLRVAHEEAQQFEFGRGEADQVVAPAHLAGVLVEHQVANHDGHRVGGQREVRTTQQGPQSQHEFLDGERFGDVVVAAGGQPGDAIADVVAGRQEQHGHPLDVRAEPAEHLEAVDVRQHDVQHHQVGAEVPGHGDGGHPVGRRPHLPPLVPQGETDQLGQGLLVVDDEQTLSELVGLALRYEGWEVRTAADGMSAIAVARDFRPDLVVLDVMLPDIDGLEVLRRLRADIERMPVLFLTARDDVSDRIAGLTAGGDDYVTKPFSIEELVLRLRALLRRSHLALTSDSSTIVVGDLILDEDSREVRRGDDLITLTATEFELLRFLMRNPKRVMSKAQILDRVWNYDFGGQANIVELYISYLRKKIDAGRDPMIHTMRGFGYVLKPAA